jgi:nitrite reductase (NADH) small subunit
MTQQTICKLDDIIPEAGVCALVSTEAGDKQVAIFRTKEDELFAIDNFDPFSNANVLSRGLIGGTVVTNEAGEETDILYVASPIYKQRFNLATGQCLDDETVKLGSYEVSLDGDTVMVGGAAITEDITAVVT